MDRRAFLVTLGGGLLAAPLGAAAPEYKAGKVARIGLLRTGSPPDPALDAFREGLRELGYVEGQNVVLDVRFAAGRLDRLPSLAAELVRRDVDVVVTGGEAAIQAARAATRTIPIVMGASNDPVGAERPPLRARRSQPYRRPSSSARSSKTHGGGKRGSSCSTRPIRSCARRCSWRPPAVTPHLAD
jgi:hypothetical protein